MHQKPKIHWDFKRTPLSKKNLEIHQSWKYRISTFFEIHETYTNSYQTPRHSIPHEGVICKPTYNFHDLLSDMQDTILDVCWKCLVHVCKSIPNSTHQAIHFSVSKHNIAKQTSTHKDLHMQSKTHQWTHSAHIDALTCPHIYAHTHTHTLTQEPLQPSIHEHAHHTSICISTHHCTTLQV